jgi:ribosomal protein S18 acetylase RimI-like enzyme
MTNSFNFIIRDGLKSDITACTELDLSYETDHVWQMTVHRASDQHSVMFQTTRLPRLMSVDPPKHQFRLVLASQQCFLVAVGRDEPQMLGYLVMQQDPVNKIALIREIAVDRPFRHRRIGTRLINVARQWATERDLEQITIEVPTKNYPAILFCQNLGLTFCGFNDQYFQNQDIAVFFGQTLR